MAVDGADATAPDWSRRCYELLIKYVNSHGEFLTEDFVQYCEEQNFPVPKERRAFGGVIMGAVRKGLIVHTGEYREKKSKQCHMNPTKVWRRK